LRRSPLTRCSAPYTPAGIHSLPRHTTDCLVHTPTRLVHTLLLLGHFLCTPSSFLYTLSTVLYTLLCIFEKILAPLASDEMFGTVYSGRYVLWTHPFTPFVCTGMSACQQPPLLRVHFLCTHSSFTLPTVLAFSRRLSRHSRATKCSAPFILDGTSYAHTPPSYAPPSFLDTPTSFLDTPAPFLGTFTSCVDTSCAHYSLSCPHACPSWTHSRLSWHLREDPRTSRLRRDVRHLLLRTVSTPLYLLS
jgi:hypothetical protein